MAKGKITLDKLATMVAKGFESLNNKLQDHDLKFVRLESRMDKLESGVSDLYRKLTLKFDVLSEKMDDIA